MTPYDQDLDHEPQSFDDGVRFHCIVLAEALELSLAALSDTGNLNERVKAIAIGQARLTSFKLWLERQRTLYGMVTTEGEHVVH